MTNYMPDQGGAGWNFDFSEAVAPKGIDPIQNGVYDFVIHNAEPKAVGDWQVLTVWLQVEASVDRPASVDELGKIVFDDWFMPNRGIQEPEKYKQTLGFLQQKLEAVYQTQIGGDFQIVPFDLIGRRVRAEIGMKRDKMPADKGGTGPNGEQLYYDPKNIVRKYLASPFGGGGNGAMQAQVFDPINPLAGYPQPGVIPPQGPPPPVAAPQPAQAYVPPTPAAYPTAAQPAAYATPTSSVPSDISASQGVGVPPTQPQPATGPTPPAPAQAAPMPTPEQIAAWQAAQVQTQQQQQPPAENQQAAPTFKL